MITFQDRLEALLQELPDTDALEESQLKKAARFKITFPYNRDADPNAPIDDTLQNVVDAMQNMFARTESLSDYDDRAKYPLPPYYGELADALIHTVLCVDDYGRNWLRWLVAAFREPRRPPSDPLARRSVSS
jgi:hypothetical protein